MIKKPQKNSINIYQTICKSFLLFCTILFTILFAISLAYYFNFKVLIKKNHLTTPIISNVSGDILNKEEADLFKNINPFGFIFYKENIKTYEQTKKLIQDLRSLFPNRKLYITIDHEGGSVDRLRNIAKKRNLTLLKSAQYYSNIAEKNLKKAKNEIYKDSRTTAKLLKEIGFDINYAPLLDITANDETTRIYSPDPQITYELALSFINGMKEEGIMTTLKHLPGIGRNKKDTHFEKVQINATKKELKEYDLIPFKKLAKKSEFGMVSHAIFTKIDDKPATLSKKTIDFIKKEVKFDGLLISDAFNMKAISSSSSYAKNTIKALDAGIDIIITNCLDHYCDAEVIRAIQETDYIKKFNEKLEKFEKKQKLSF